MTSDRLSCAGDVSLVVAGLPNPESLCRYIARRALASLKARQVIVHDLYGLGFNPATTKEEFGSYCSDNIPEDIRCLVDDLRPARELIFLPVWMFAMPAILKGYLERV